MVARVQPSQMKVTHISIQEKGDSPDTVIQDLGQKRQRGEIEDNFGSPITAGEFGGLKLTYRTKPAALGEHRRYYIGYVQFGFVRLERDRYIVHLTGQDDAPDGCEFVIEADVLNYLKKQLVLK